MFTIESSASVDVAVTMDKRLPSCVESSCRSEAHGSWPGLVARELAHVFWEQRRFQPRCHVQEKAAGEAVKPPGMRVRRPGDCPLVPRSFLGAGRSWGLLRANMRPLGSLRSCAPASSHLCVSSAVWGVALQLRPAARISTGVVGARAWRGL